MLYREYSQTGDKSLEGDSVLLLLVDTKFRDQYAACLSAAWGLGGRISVKTALTAFNDFEAPLNHDTELATAPLSNSVRPKWVCSLKIIHLLTQ
jgi:hypothetical protein